DLAGKIAAGEAVKISSPLSHWLGAPGSWTSNPVEAFLKPATESAPAKNVFPGMLGAFLAIGAVFALAMQVRGIGAAAFLKAFPVVFLLAILSFVLAGQSLIKAYNLEYALWALLVGLIICNTIGTP